jgi:hypothetical protein
MRIHHRRVIEEPMIEAGLTPRAVVDEATI